jgi:hypothetical protein
MLRQTLENRFSFIKMYTPPFDTQCSDDLGVYLPSQISIQEILAYESSDVLIRSIHIETLPSAHRYEFEMFDPINDDLDAVSKLTNDEQRSMFDDNAECCVDTDDFSKYFMEKSSVEPHIPNPLIESTFGGYLQLLPSSKDIYTNQQTSPSTPSSPIDYNCSTTKKFRVFDDITGRERRPLLHEFIRLVLENDEYAHLAAYIDRKRGTFKLYKPKEVAELWKYVKGRNSDIGKSIFLRKTLFNMIIFIFSEMTYDKLARAIRYYYASGIMHSSAGRYTFRFGAKSGFGTTWWPAYQQT